MSNLQTLSLRERDWGRGVMKDFAFKIS